MTDNRKTAMIHVRRSARPRVPLGLRAAPFDVLPDGIMYGLFPNCDMALFQTTGRLRLAVQAGVREAPR